MIKFSSLTKLQQDFWDNLDRPNERPEGQRIQRYDETPGVIDESNFEQYEPDQLDQETPNWMNELPTGQEFVSDNAREVEYNPEQGMPEDPEMEYDSKIGLVEDGMNNQEVIGFEYVTRKGVYAGHRIVEPHYTFVPYTTDSGEILVGWDRTRVGHPRGAIRSFIIRNIRPEKLTRYEGEAFSPKEEIMRGI